MSQRRRTKAEDYGPTGRPRFELDVEALSQTVNRLRLFRGMAWAEVEAETQLDSNVFQRLVAGRTLSLSSYITLCVWIGHYPAFIRRVIDDSEPST